MTGCGPIEETIRRIGDAFPSASLRNYPGEGGGRLIEFEAEGWDLSVEISPDGTMEAYGISIAGAETIEPVRIGDPDDLRSLVHGAGNG